MNYLKSMKNAKSFNAFFVVAMLLMTESAFAMSTSDNMPWTGPLQTIYKSMTGPFAVVVVSLAFVACGAALLFGSELTDFVKKLLTMVVAGSFMLGTTQIITTIFGVSALIR
ncbi:MAG: conjugal transfer protein [Proteobacteria bacterium]|nr:MAG: conjugal transfer protein [Pseudomonadota bacterium]